MKARREHQLVGEALELVVHAPGRLAVRSEKRTPARFRRFLLRALVGHQLVLQVGPRAVSIAPPQLVISEPALVREPATMAPNTEQHGDDRLGPARWRVRCASWTDGRHDMSGFMREHADDLIGRLGFHQRAALTKIRCASMTKALNDLSLMMTTWMFWLPRPATFKIGWV